MSAGEAARAPVDPGLQPERTRLAWSRTALAFLANGGLVLHAGHRADHRAWLLPGAAVIALSALVYAVGELRYRRVGAAVRANTPVAGAALVATAAAAAVFTALMAVVAMAAGS
ncbi:DUF202 domain-containing protein [Yinghuangia sp. ASG 101]|uniref:DUF202 domain-containing protein n=1 Tax=Yinghuangia sp. ASG 101 TaxID=2896848 RepID=UPI001E2D4398|nr:DUF202 domain-containing protein [Yinghuangia sp. ASG 101]UGQ13069.1 DUF202 domain-containing protein [Yinghuangia sp. ASG 101]